MAEYLTFHEIALEVGVSYDTVRRTARKIAEDKKIKVVRRVTPNSKGALVNSLSIEDANKLFQHFESRQSASYGKAKDESAFQRYGYFYVIQLIPEAIPNRVKIGYTDNLDSRLKEHQASAPTACYVASWACKRSWDQAAMDSITREDCELVMNEVYEGDIQKFVERGNAFFEKMPNRKTKVKLAKHSPLKDKR
jgi:predicted GIY-YIG superfamily endonuclease